MTITRNLHVSRTVPLARIFTVEEKGSRLFFQLEGGTCLSLVNVITVIWRTQELDDVHSYMYAVICVTLRWQIITLTLTNRIRYLSQSTALVI